jgi:hypothetical protein
METHSSHHFRNPVFTDYARKENGVLGTDTTFDDDSAKQHSLLSNVEEAAVEWCHSALLATPSASHRTGPPQQQSDQHPRIIQPRYTFASALMGRQKLAWDESTPSTLSASTASYDSLSSGNTSLEVEEENDDIRAPKSSSVSTSWHSSMPTMKRKTGKSVVSESLDAYCQKKCGMLCLTTEAAFQRMLLGENAKDTTVKGDLTAEESSSSSSSSFNSSEDSAQANKRLYSESLLSPKAPNNRNKGGLQPKFNTRFSSLWKKTVKDHRFRALTKEQLHNSQTIRGICEARQRDDIEVRLMTESDPQTKSTGNHTATYTRGGTLPHSFRRLMQLRNERQHGKAQRAENERFLTEHKVSVIANTSTPKPHPSSRPFDEDSTDVERGGKTSGVGRLKIQRKPQERKPFDEDSTDVEHCSSNAKLAAKRQPLSPSGTQQKPFDEGSRVLGSSPAFGEGSLKIVGKWREAGEDDSGFYSVADTPFMKRSMIYRARTNEETGTTEEEMHDEFSKMREALAAKNQGKEAAAKGDTGKEATPLENRDEAKRLRSLTNLERKLGKSRQPPQNASMCSSSLNSSDFSSSDALSTVAVLAAFRNRTSIAALDTESEESCDQHSNAAMATYKVDRRPALSSIKESEWDMPSGSSIYEDDSETVDDSETADDSSAAAIHKSFQF